MTRPDIEALDGVAAILVDQVRLYDRAADMADDPTAKASIAEVSGIRANLLIDIQKRLLDLGAAKDSHGTLLGAGHKAFLEARAVVDDNSHAAVREVLRGEEYLRDQIHKLLKKGDLSPPTTGFLENMLAVIKPGHDAIGVIHADFHARH